MRKAMVDADKTKLEEVVADQLSYGHSADVIENKAEFVGVIARKKRPTNQSTCWSRP